MTMNNHHNELSHSHENFQQRLQLYTKLKLQLHILAEFSVSTVDQSKCYQTLIQPSAIDPPREHPRFAYNSQTIIRHKRSNLRLGSRSIYKTSVIKVAEIFPEYCVVGFPCG